MDVGERGHAVWARKHYSGGPVPGSVIGRLRRLAPRHFEHLTYDLLVLSGLRNATWRTPGPDAGRDVEGEYLSSDLSETLSVQRWYVECKHYSAAIDWPTIFSKLAYAANHGADFLLFATTSHVSPRAKEEIARRDQQRARPAVRVWDAPVLENLVTRHPFLLDKYGLAPASTTPISAKAAPLVALSSKVVQAAYGHAALQKAQPAALEFAAALVDLLAARQAGWRDGWSRFLTHRDSYPWLKIVDGVDLRNADSYGIRAILTAVRFYLRASAVTLDRAHNAACTIPIHGLLPSPTLRESLHAIALWTNLEVVVRARYVRLSVRG